MSTVLLPFNPVSFSPRLPGLSPPLANALADSGAAFAREAVAGRIQSPGSFNWIASDSKGDAIVPTHGNFAGPGYGAGKRNPTKEELKNGLVALVRDINGNGTIDTGRELFGDSTRLANGALAANGFAALADLDSNLDGKIDSTDAAFGELKIWRDLNQDGISQANELSTLTDLGIRSLDTTGTRVSITVPGGSQILTGSYTKADGTTSTMADLNLTQDTFYSQYTDSITVPQELADLPDLAGMGRLRNLREAAADGYKLCAERKAA